MSTPTESLADLSLGSPTSELISPDLNMAPTAVIRARAIVMQDIISSFDKTALPSEIEPGTFSNILQNLEKPYALRPRSSEEWTISGNLLGTLLQRGAYDEDTWAAFKRIQTPTYCAVGFLERMKARFDICLSRYDDLQASPPPAANLTEAMDDIVGSFTSLSETLNQDRERRQYADIAPNVEVRALTIALEALQAVTQRTDAIIPTGQQSSRRASRRTVSNVETHPSLFEALIGQVGPDDSPFLIGAFEKFESTTLNECSELLVSIDDTLSECNVPAAYIERFRKLQDKARGPSEPITSIPRSGHGYGLEAESRSGIKRSQPGAEASTSTSKRGKRSGGR